MQLSIDQKDIDKFLMIGDKVLIKPKNPQSQTKTGLYSIHRENRFWQALKQGLCGRFPHRYPQGMNQKYTWRLCCNDWCWNKFQDGFSGRVCHPMKYQNQECLSGCIQCGSRTGKEGMQLRRQACPQETYILEHALTAQVEDCLLYTSDAADEL